MSVVVLPRLGSREGADKLAALLGDVRGKVLTVSCRELLSASPTYAGQLVRRLVVEGGARELVVVNPDDEFLAALLSEARARGVADRVRVGTFDDLLV